MATIRLTQGLVPAVARASRHGERIILSRGGRPVAAIVPLGDLRVLENLDKLEDEYWVRIADEAMADERPSIPWEQVRAESGL